MTSLNTQLNRMSPQQALLFSNKRAFFDLLVSNLRTIAPETLAVWCYGLNALRPLNVSKDWDFIAILPSHTPAEYIEQLNQLNSALASYRIIGNQSFDIQALAAGDHSPFARQVREEGFCVWQMPIRLA